MSLTHEICPVILAGGLGTRISSIVGDRPKALAEVNGRPFLYYILDQLASVGIRKAVLCTGHLAEQVYGIIGEKYGSIKLEYSVESEPSGTGGALRLALPLISSDPALVMNGDSYCEINLMHLAGEHSKKMARTTLVLAESNDISRFGRVDINKEGAVTRIQEKGGQHIKGLISAGIYLISKTVIQSFPDEIPLSLERRIFPGLVGQGLYGFVSSGRFIDIGIPEDYYAASAFFYNSSLQNKEHQ